MNDARPRIEEAQADIERGHYAQAERQLEAVMAGARLQADGSLGAEVQWILGGSYVRQGRHDDAARSYAAVAEHHDRYLSAHREVPPKVAERYVGELCLVGAFLVDTAHTDDAETVLYAAMSGARRHLDGTALEVAQVLFQMGRVAQARGDVAEADAHLRRSIDGFRQAKTRVPTILAEGLGWALHRLGESLSAQYRFSEAEPMLLEGYRVLQERYDSDGPELGYVLVSLARLYIGAGRLEQAATFYKRSITVGSGSQNQDQVLVAQRMTELAELYWRAEQYQQAEALFERAIDRMGDTLGLGHSLVADILQRMADLHWDLGHLDAAVGACFRALDLLDEVVDVERRDEVAIATVLHQLASLRFEQGELNEALKLATRSLKVFDTHLPGGAEHASALNLLGQIARGLGRLQEAEHWLMDSIALMVRAVGEGDPRVITSVNNMAQVCLDAGTPQNAEGVLRWALNVAAKELGTTHPQVELAVNLLWQVLVADDRKDEAQELISWATG